MHGLILPHQFQLWPLLAYLKYFLLTRFLPKWLFFHQHPGLHFNIISFKKILQRPNPTIFGVSLSIYHRYRPPKNVGVSKYRLYIQNQGSWGLNNEFIWLGKLIFSSKGCKTTPKKFFYKNDIWIAIFLKMLFYLLEITDNAWKMILINNNYEYISLVLTIYKNISIWGASG